MSKFSEAAARPYLMLAAIIILWGVNFIVARLLSGILPIRVSGVYYALFRYSLGALTMIGVLAYPRKGSGLIFDEVRPYRRILGLSALFSAIFVVSTHMSAEYITSGTTSIIVNLCPIIVLVFGVVYLREGLTLLKTVGFSFGLLGGGLFLWSTSTLQPGLELGIMFALVGMVSWAAYTVSLQYLKDADRYVVMTVKHAVSTLMV